MSMKVLIVDSDWSFARQAADILEPCGHHVVQEARPRQALAAAVQWRPDVILVSAEMPQVCDGELLQSLGDLRPRPALLLVSALGRFDKAWRAWRRGGEEVLFKPILHPSELHVAIMIARENAVLPRRDHVAARPAAKSA